MSRKWGTTLSNKSTVNFESTVNNVVPHFLDIEIHPDGLSIFTVKIQTQANTLILIAILLGDIKHLGFPTLYIVQSRYAVIIN